MENLVYLQRIYIFYLMINYLKKLNYICKIINYEFLVDYRLYINFVVKGFKRFILKQ